MKQNIKNIMTIAALLLTMSVARAAGDVKVVPSNDGTVNASVAGTTCTLTVTPADGYYITAEHIKVVKVVDAGEAQSRRTPGIDDDVISVTATDATADPSGVTTYTFTMPGGQYDAEVTADFQQRVNIAAATVTVAEGTYVYNGQPYQPAVTSVVLGPQTLSANEYAVAYQDNTNAGTATVVVTGQRTFTGQATTTFTIDRAPVTVTFSTAAVTLNINDVDSYEQQPTVSLNDVTLQWTSSEESVAKVANGVVTLKGYGVVTITAAFAGNDNYQPASASYQLTVKNTFPLTIGGVQVTSDNRSDVVGSVTSGKVQFDGKGALILENVEGNPETADFIVCNLPSLTIYIKGNCNVGCIVGSGGTLTFTTEGNEPGTMRIENKTGSAVAVSGFDNILYDQNLAPLDGGADKMLLVIGTPVPPLTNNDNESKQVSVADVSETSLTNTVVDNVLYTVPDAIEEVVQDDHIKLSSIYVESDDDLGKYQPGTIEYAKEFAGLTFMVPAGTGKIIINAKTGEEGVLKVKIGNEEPLSFTHLIDFTEVEIPYACSEATYVYVYNGSEPAADGSRRASKKTHVTVGIRTVGVSSQSVQTSNEMSKSIQSQAESENIGKVVDSEQIDHHIEQSDESMAINNDEVVSLDDNAFADLLGQFISSVDLRNTNVMGLTVNRSEGAFNGLSENTFIYLPTGNKAADGEVNVIFGNICPKAVLNVDMAEGESFAPATDFIAQQIELNRHYGDGEMSTVYLPFDIDYASAALLGTFYTFAEAKNGFVRVEEVTSGTLTAHTPYLFRAAADKISMRVVHVTLPPAGARRFAPVATDDGLHGCYTATNNTSAYKLTGTDFNDLKFERMSSSDVIRPFEAYLTLSDASASSLLVTDDEGVVTGICTVAGQQPADRSVYDLSGRRVDSTMLRVHSSQLQKGVYIHQGRKIVIR